MKKINFSFVFIFLFSFSCLRVNNHGSSLLYKMDSMSVNNVLVVNSQAIDERPLWSKNSDFIAYNIEGEWYKTNLNKSEIKEAIWHGQKIGFIENSGDDKLPITKDELKSFYKNASNTSREVKTTTGVKIELKLNGLFAEMILTKNLGEVTKLWKTNLENCHSLSLSPDENYVAYICELSGLFIMKTE